MYRFISPSPRRVSQILISAVFTMSSASDDDHSSAAEHEVNENMKVFCRLRPMNKLEMSKRSKNCVDLPEEDPRCITVDSPLEGEYDFYFARVSIQKETLHAEHEGMSNRKGCNTMNYGADSGSGHCRAFFLFARARLQVIT